MVVDHNRLFREDLAFLLEWRTGFRSVHAESLVEAKAILEKANHKKSACVVVDLELLEGEGTELLKELSTVAASTANPKAMSTRS